MPCLRHCRPRPWPAQDLALHESIVTTVLLARQCTEHRGWSMRFKVPTALIATALLWLGALAVTSRAAECGGVDRPPCAPSRAAPKPAAPKPAVQKPSAPQRSAAPEPSAAAVDITLSKIPDIIVPEPKGKTQPDQAVIEFEAATVPPSRPVQAPSQPAYTRRHGPED
jgi:hypothetical protein